MPTNKSDSPSMTGVIIALIVAILALSSGVAVLLWRGAQSPKDVTSAETAYSAVFLDNGQVYFGELTREDENFWQLASPYYIAAQPPGTDPQKANVSLSKVGSEVHGPTPEMEINVEHVLFIEELREDSEVAKAMRGG